MLVRRLTIFFKDTRISSQPRFRNAMAGRCSPLPYRWGRRRAGDAPIGGGLMEFNRAIGIRIGGVTKRIVGGQAPSRNFCPDNGAETRNGVKDGPPQGRLQADSTRTGEAQPILRGVGPAGRRFPRSGNAHVADSDCRFGDFCLLRLRQTEIEPATFVLDVRTCWPVRSQSEIEKIPIGPDNLVVRSLELLAAAKRLHVRGPASGSSSAFRRRPVWAVVRAMPPRRCDWPTEPGEFIGATTGWPNWRPRSAAMFRFSCRAAQRFAAGVASASSDCRRIAPFALCDRQAAGRLEHERSLSGARCFAGSRGRSRERAIG